MILLKFLKYQFHCLLNTPLLMKLRSESQYDLIYKENNQVRKFLNKSYYLVFKFIVFCYCLKVPDSLLVPLLKERLGQLDCVSRGWVLHGYPRTREQAEALERCGFTPNRFVYFLFFEFHNHT